MLVDLWVPVPSMVIVGPGAIGDALIAQAGLLGWVAGRADTVAEADAAVAAFTDADVLVLLDHDPAFDAVLRTGLAGARVPRRAGLAAHPGRPPRAPARRRRHGGPARPHPRPRRARPRCAHAGRDGGVDRRRGARRPERTRPVGAGRGGGADRRVSRMPVPAPPPPRPGPRSRPSPGRHGSSSAPSCVALLLVGGTAFRVWQVARVDDREPVDASSSSGPRSTTASPADLPGPAAARARALRAGRRAAHRHHGRGRRGRRVHRGPGRRAVARRERRAGPRRCCPSTRAATPTAASRPSPPSPRNGAGARRCWSATRGTRCGRAPWPTTSVWRPRPRRPARPGGADPRDPAPLHRPRDRRVDLLPAHPRVRRTSPTPGLG